MPPPAVAPSPTPHSPPPDSDPPGTNSVAVRTVSPLCAQAAVVSGGSSSESGSESGLALAALELSEGAVLAEEGGHAGAFVTRPSVVLRSAAVGELDEEVLSADVYQYCSELRERGVGEGSEFVAEAMMASFGSMGEGFLGGHGGEEEVEGGGEVGRGDGGVGGGDGGVGEGDDAEGGRLLHRLSVEALSDGLGATAGEGEGRACDGDAEEEKPCSTKLRESVDEPRLERENRMRAALELLLFGGESVGGEEGRVAMRVLEEGLRVASSEAERRRGVEKVLREVYRAVADFGEVDAGVVERAAGVMAKLAVDVADVAGVIAGTGGIAVLLEAVKKHQGSEGVHDVSIYALLAVTQDEEGRAQIVENRGVEFVTNAMNAFPGVRSVATNGSLTLCNLAYAHEENKKRIGKVGGIDAVLNAMSFYAGDADVQARCCLALRNLTFGSKANQWIAGRACAMENIVKCMRAFPDDKEVQYYGLVALGNLVADAGQNRERASSIDVVPTVLETIKAAMGNAALVEHGMTVLRNLSIGCEENQLLIGDGGGVQLTMNCLKKYRTHEGIIVNGCSALRYLFFARRNRETMFNCGHLELLVRILRDSAEVAEVAEKVILALGNASFDVYESKRALGRFGGVSAVVDVMGNHLDAENLQAYGCRTLRNLADCDELNVRLLGESGAIDVVIYAIMGYRDNEDIQEQAFAMLFNMAFSENNLKLMRDMEVMKVAQHALSYHEPNARIQLQAGALIRRLKALTEGGSQTASPMHSAGPLSKKKSSSPFERKKSQGLSTAMGRGKKNGGKAANGN